MELKLKASDDKEELLKKRKEETYAGSIETSKIAAQ
jgi:hypothetical protein